MSKERVTVSLDAELVQELKPAADRAGMASVSQYVEDAVRTRVARDAWLARWTALAGRPDARALEQARAVLRASGPTPTAADLAHPRAS